MKTTSPDKKHADISVLVAAARQIKSNALAEAGATDNVDSFPIKTLAEIFAASLHMTAVPKLFGGQDLGLKPGTNLALLQVLKEIGAGNLVMGRVLEGHINAQLLIDEFGTESQKKQFAKEAFNGHLFGVWNTQANDGTFLTEKNGRHFLHGSKTFATGIDYVSRPIITAALPDGGWQMCVVCLEKADTTVDKNWWHPMGMRSTRSYKITFNATPVAPENLLGQSGDYYKQPGFSGGSTRFAAVQFGAAEMLFEETRNYLQQLNRTEDPFQKMRIGQMAVAIASGNQWLIGAAGQMDEYLRSPSEENSQKFLAYANMMRTAIEQICVEVMNLCQKCVGARGLNKPYNFERIIRDLSTYLRQPAPDAALADIGRFVLQSTNDIGDLWSSKNK